jgi:hypothetical protein
LPASARLEELSAASASRVHEHDFMSLDFPIRLANRDDAPEVARLLHVDDVGGLPLAVLGKHYLLVVDAPDGGLAAAAIVRLEQPRAHLRCLAVAKSYEDRGLEDRVIGFVEDMADAFGCTQIDVPFRRNAA